MKAAPCGREQPPRFGLLRSLTGVLNDVPLKCGGGEDFGAGHCTGVEPGAAATPKGGMHDCGIEGSRRTERFRGARSLGNGLRVDVLIDVLIHVPGGPGPWRPRWPSSDGRDVVSSSRKERSVRSVFFTNSAFP